MGLLKLLFENGDHSVRLEGAETKVAFYIENLEECENDVVKKCVDIFNIDNDLEAVDQYLQDEDMCIQEDREEIIEGIFNIL